MLLGVLLVPLVAILHHPLVEGLSYFRVDDVADVLPGHLADLLHVWEAVHDLRVAEAPVEDGVQGEALVLGDGDVVDFVSVDGL